MTFYFVAWIIVVYNVVQRGTGMYKYFNEEMTWDAARDACSRFDTGGLAVDSEELRLWIQNNRTILLKSWIGQYTVLSPWMYTKGCFSIDLVKHAESTSDDMSSGNQTYVTKWIDIGHMTQWGVGTCQRFCKDSNLFAFQNKRCFCLGLPVEELFLFRVDDSRCRFYCTSGQGGACGGRNGVSVYRVAYRRTVTDDTLTSSAPPLCSVVDRGKNKILTLDCSQRAHSACSKVDSYLGEITRHTYINHASNWFIARKMCRKNGAILPDIWLPSYNRSGVFWTGRFREVVSVTTDDTDLEEDTRWRLSCQTMKFDKAMFKLVNRSCDEKLPFICQMNVTDSLKSHTSAVHTKPFSASTTVTLNFTIGSSENSNMTVKKTKNIYKQETEKTTRRIISTVLEKKPPKTFVIVIIFSCGLISLIVILLLFRKMRKSLKRKSQSAAMCNQSNHVNTLLEENQTCRPNVSSSPEHIDDNLPINIKDINNTKVHFSNLQEDQTSEPSYSKGD